MISDYRILVVEDEHDTRLAIEDELHDISPGGRLDWDFCQGVREAVRKVKAKYYDLILVDLELGKNRRGGLDLYTHLAENSASAKLLLMTHIDMDSGMAELYRLFSDRRRPHFVGFIDKRENFTRQLRDEVGVRFSEFTSYSAEFENIDLAAELIEHRRHRYSRPGLFPLRVEGKEIGAEVDRLMRQLYVELPTGVRKSSIRVSLEPVDRRGLSSAIVLNAVVNVNPDSYAAIPGHKTVLKIGPCPDILEEAARYHEFVRFGVELDQRVEMLGTATGDTLGALVYSFAGGLHRQELTTLDEVLRRELLTGRVKLSREVLYNLFDSKRWYSVVSSKQRVADYVEENYRSDLRRSSAASDKFLRELPSKLTRNIRIEHSNLVGEDIGLTISVPGAPPVEVPGASVLGSGTLLTRVATCLVHGDMHGGNVMLEADAEQPGTEGTTLRRVCLIDYRNSGFGPRCIDGVALESSIRLADSEAECRKLDDVGESGLTARQKASVAAVMARRKSDELSLYRHAFEGNADRPEGAWTDLALEVLTGIRKCFPDVTLKEYLATAIPYVIRNLGYDGVLPVARVRMCAWLSALKELAGSRDPAKVRGGSRKER